MFNRDAFLVLFAASLDMLAQSESVTKRELRTLSRSVLEYSIETGDVGVVNRLLNALTPVNRKVCVVFFKHFVAFKYHEDTHQFTAKAPKQWDEKLKLAKEFLADPMNNIWTWADRNIEIQKKDFALDQVTDAFKKFVKKAQSVNLTQKDVLKAVLQSGVELDTVLALMGEMYDVEVNAA